ncbi:MAG: hypothetical protein Q7S06_00915 [Nanoarchaeota archaeon]|nr:hypothetical protein [Nanoarchaeota archaeon]
MAKTLGDCLFDGGVKDVIFIEKSSGKTYKAIGLSRSSKEREFILHCEFGSNIIDKSYLWNHYEDEVYDAQSQPK